MRIVSIVSARPNFVKLASIVHALKSHPDIEHVIVHTGQHYDPLFSDIFFEQLEIPVPDFNLEIKGGDRERVITETDTVLRALLPEITPDIVLVYGDVNGALAGARAAKVCKLLLGHIESGLRSGDLSMPEERNRIEIDQIADLLFVSEESGVRHLRRENVHGSIHFVGNTMIDALIRVEPLIDQASLPAGINPPYGVVTLHRPSNVDDPDILQDVLLFLGEISRHLPLILPIHHRLKASLDALALSIPPGLQIISALGYLHFLRLLKDASLILTDSGGIQEEAVYLRKKCFTLRRNTERPVTIESGSNQLIDPTFSDDRDLVLAFAKNPMQPSVTIPELWDGKAGERIVEILRSF